MKNKLIHSFLSFAIIAIASLSLFTGTVNASSATTPQTSEVETEDVTISPRKDIIDWRFMWINGVLHRRQFNYSMNMWIGEWIPV